MAKKSKQPSPGDLGQHDVYLWKEWDETWAHARHLESARMRYLGFLFTATFAVIAVVANGAERLPIEGTTFASLFGGMVLALALLALFVQLTVERLNLIYRMYNTAIFKMRRRCADSFPDSAGTRLWGDESPPRGRVSTISEWVPRSIFTVCCASLLAYTIGIACVRSTPTASLVVAALTTLAAFGIYAFGRWARSAGAS